MARCSGVSVPGGRSRITESLFFAGIELLFT
jgi:hypothetical protein